MDDGVVELFVFTLRLHQRSHARAQHIVECLAQFRQFVTAGQTGARVVVALTDLFYGGHHLVKRIHDGAIGCSAQAESNAKTEQGDHRDQHCEGVTGALRGFQILRGALLCLCRTRQQRFEKGINQRVKIVANKQIQLAAIPHSQ